MSLSLPTPLVDAAWVADHLDHPDLVILDCRFSLADPELGRRQYQERHLPGAHYLHLNQDLSSPVQTHGGRHPLPDLADLVPKLERCGVRSPKNGPLGPLHPPTAVIVYDDFRGAFASRLWWLLHYLGHDTVAVLQGGYSGWQRAGLPTTTQLPPPSSELFQPRPQKNWVVDHATAEALNQQSGVTLVDARSPERFRGEQEPIDPIAGSIPGAINSFWQQVVDEEGVFLPPANLQAHWAPLDSTEVVMYCGSGVTACVNLLSRVAAGYPMDRLYVGGWSDWCSYL
ncbi:sulfurtransferase [Leptolyngbya sp. PCC 6406]|uniref:sulfurtransferase n=1 Tax=Leptolyngbya sp. PCC 6406 TaxID=1173264 RepID=UPI0002ABDD28|nr:sulfurtransferase [Leptolyngbya sp. PCC 6406]